MTLEIGTKLKLMGGYEPHPIWLGGENAYVGQIESVYPTKAGSPPLIAVRLKHPITWGNLRGDILFLKLRYANAEWEEAGVVQAYLFDSLPTAPPT